MNDDQYYCLFYQTICKRPHNGTPGQNLCVGTASLLILSQYLTLHTTRNQGKLGRALISLKNPEKINQIIDLRMLFEGIINF